MRRSAGIRLLVVAGVVTLGIWLVGRTQSFISVELQGAPVIHAGDAWELSVFAADAAPGEQLFVSLFNGLNRIDERLILGTGGVAVWHLPEETITQAGESLVVAVYAEQEVRHHFRVLPRQPEAMDLLTTANNIPAYGDGQAMIIVLPRDKWGNPPSSNDVTITTAVQFPDGSSKDLENHSVATGLAWSILTSQGNPGRVRVDTQIFDVTANLELKQSPGAPAVVSIMASPACVLNDGRDLVTLTAQVTDLYGSNVVNGTLVTFLWPGGRGYGTTIDGKATMRLPAFLEADDYRLEATSQRAASNRIVLEVVEQDCLR